MKRIICLILVCFILVAGYPEVIKAAGVCPNCNDSTYEAYCSGTYDHKDRHSHILSGGLECYWFKFYFKTHWICSSCSYDEFSGTHLEYENQHYYYPTGACDQGFKQKCFMAQD